MPTRPSPHLSGAHRVDAACDRFEADWKAGNAPRIQDALAAADPDDRESLFRALLGVELELRAKAGESLGTAAYKARFPEYATAVMDVFRELIERRKPASGDTSVVKESVSTAAGPPRPAGKVVAASPGRLGRFELLELLGEGAFGQVYRARDPHLDREVAIKVPRSDAVGSADDRERFLREAKSAATVSHPNVCPVYEAGEDGGRMYIVMALIAGKSLAALLKERKEPLPERQAAQVARKLALALDAAHAKGVVHRDLKPANVMFDRDRKDVVVMDFGLARRTAAGDAELTGSGMILGTPAYMAPEQASGGAKAVGPAADIFSLGVVLYEMLTSRRPFRGGVGEVIGQILHVHPEPPSKVRADVDPRLEAVCLKAMAKDPAARYGSMKEMAAALAECLKPPAATASAPTREGAAAAATDESMGLQQMFAALSDERRQTAAAVEAALKRHRTPWWVWAASSGFAGLIAVLGVIFFARTPTATVLIDVNVDLNDQSLSFVLDGKPVPAEHLAVPVQLPVGEHELLVYRGEAIVRKFLFTVSKDAGPRVGVTEVPVPPTPPARGEAVWTPLLRSAAELVEGDTIYQNNGNRNVRFEDGVLILRGTGASFRPKFAGKNYILRAQILHFSGGQNVTFKLRCRPGFYGYDGFFNNQDPASDIPSYGLGKIKPGKPWQALGSTKQRLTYDFPVDFAVAVYGPELSVYVNGVRVVRDRDTESAEGTPEFYLHGGHAMLRDLRACRLDGTDLMPDDVFPQKDDPKALQEVTPEYLTADLKKSNLMRNSSFEAADTSMWSVESWRNRADCWRIVPGPGRDGEKLLLIDNPEPDSVGVKQTVAVRPGKRYLFAGRIKTEAVRAVERRTHGAHLYVWGGYERLNTNLEGTNDWTYQSVVFRAGPRTSVTVGARLGNFASTASGKAWFDDLCLVELPEESVSPAANPGLKAWQGRWRCVGEKGRAKIWTPDEVKAAGKVMDVVGNRLIIEGTLDGKFGRYTGTVSLSPWTSPTQFDWDGTSPDGASLRFSGLFALEGRRLRLIYRIAPADRPPSRARWTDVNQPSVVWLEFEPADVASGFVPLFNGNDVKTARAEDTTYGRGHVALQARSDAATGVTSVAQFRKTETLEEPRAANVGSGP